MEQEQNQIMITGLANHGQLEILGDNGEKEAIYRPMSGKGTGQADTVSMRPRKRRPEIQMPKGDVNHRAARGMCLLLG